MAHFVRPLALAESLDPAQYEVHFYAPRRFSHFLNGKPFATGELSTMPGEQFLANISKGAPLFPTAVIREYVRQDRELIAHGGQEATLLALGNTFYHWGGIIVPPGYTDPIQFQSGNPYGTSHVAGDGAPSDVALHAARYQARRVVDTAAALKAGRAA